MNKKTKLLFITNLPTPYRVKFFNELALLFDLTVIFEARYTRKTQFNWIDENEYRFKKIFLLNGYIREKTPNFRILKHLKRDKYDYIIISNYSYATEILAILYLKIFHIQFLYEFDGSVFRKENPLKKLVKIFLINGAIAYFSPSNSTDKFIKSYTNSKVKIIRYPFTSLSKRDILTEPVSEDHKSYLRQKLGIKHETVVLAVGQFIHRKGFDVLIKAIDEIDSNENIGFYLVGGKPTEELLKLYNNNKNKDKIVFVDFLNDEELDSYYRASNLFVLPTREDVWGLVINEALSKGLPVVSTYNCVAAVELIRNGENGYVINKEDTHQLCQAIIESISCKSNLLEMSNNALKSIKNHTFESMANIHYSEILKLIRSDKKN